MSPWLIAALLLLAALVIFWTVWPTPAARWLMTAQRRLAHLHSRRLRFGEIDWHYLEGGSGEPLILLHGFNGSADHFTPASRYLTNHFRVLAPDIPGFGETEIPQQLSFSIDDQAERILEWIDALGIQRFYLGGNSMGGYLAAAVARRAPARVHALWLLAPGGLENTPLSPVFEEIVQERHNPLVVRNRADFNRLADYCFVRPPWIPEPIKRFLTARAARTETRTRRIFDSLRFDSRPLETLIDGLETPTLIIWGDSDQVLHPDGLELLAERMPNSRHLLLSETGHLPMIERPQVAAEAWHSFTRAHDAGL